MRDQFTQVPLALCDVPSVPLSRHSGKPRTGAMFVCERCGATFYRYQADITKAEKNGGRIRFCSKACDHRVKSETNIPRTCHHCGAGFVVWASAARYGDEAGTRWGIYCSASCRDTANGIRQRSAVEVPCSACGTPMRRIPANIRPRMFCSRACFATMVGDWAVGGRGNVGYRPDIDLWVRSSWEANVARVLKRLGIPYAYESRTFRLPNGKAYRPDFLVAGMWVEVKGWMTEANAAKIAAFRAAYPDEPLIVLGKDEYRLLADAFGLTIPEWEHPWERWGARKYALRSPERMARDDRGAT